jgi:hypothetical protein
MRIFLLLITLSFSHISVAGSPLTDSAREFMQHYIQSYNNYLDAEEEGDIMAVAQHFHEPTTLVSPGRKPRHIANHQQLSKGLANFVAVMKKQGATKLQWHKLDVIKLDKNHALASGIVDVSNAKDEVIDRKAAFYSLYKSETAWSMILNQGHDIENSPSFRIKQ